MSVIFGLTDVIIAGIIIYFVYDAIVGYKNSTGTTWERILAAGKGSVTILWQRFVVLVTGLSGGLVILAEYLNAPGVADTIKSVIQPQYVAIFVIGMAIISEFARRRTL